MSKIPFEKLETSTRTVMVYSNILFDLPNLFKNIPLTNVDIPFTKKQKNVDKKKLNAPDGAIISLQLASKLRGVNTRKNKKTWCSVCRPTEIHNNREIKINTLTEFVIPNLNDDGTLKDDHLPSDAYFINYWCSRCNRSYEVSEIKKINHFLNQLTIVLSIGKQPLLNIMMFKDNLKIAGCKDEIDAHEAILCLWHDYLSKIPHSFCFMDDVPRNGTDVHRNGTDVPSLAKMKFIFDGVMRNVDFNLGFPVERVVLNEVMNEPRYREKVYMSTYEAMGPTNVNIKMYAQPDAGHRYNRLVVTIEGGDGDPESADADDGDDDADTASLASSSPYKTRDIYFNTTQRKKYSTTKEKKKEIYTTFIVFSSSETILSGKYDSSMKENYEFFNKIINENRDKLEEKIRKPKEKAIADLLSRVSGDEILKRVRSSSDVPVHSREEREDLRREDLMRNDLSRTAPLPRKYSVSSEDTSIRRRNAKKKIDETEDEFNVKIKDEFEGDLRERYKKNQFSRRFIPT